jgi:phosphatidylglycerophosphate synthase
MLRRLLPLVPRSIETYHLTLTTIVWSALVIVAGWFAYADIRWLWLASFAIALQYLTDLLDGAVGRARGTGLVKWGYYMDHFLDFVFLSAIVIGYALAFHERYVLLHLALLAVYGAFMMHAHLAFAATNEFRIAFSGVGPTEVRIAFILTNTLLIVFGKTYLAWLIPWLIAAALLGLAVVVLRTQRELWSIDMAAKKKDDSSL